MRSSIISYLALTLLLSLIPTAFSQAARVPGTNYSTALELTVGEHTFYLERGDVHYFAVRLERDDTLYILLTPPTNQDFDMALVSPSRDVIELSVRATGFTERITYTAPSSGIYYIVVFPFGASSGAYSLLIGISKPRVTTVISTVTVASYITLTQKELRDVVIVMTRESYRTVTVTSQQLVGGGLELLGWSVLSLAILAVAVLIRDGIVRARPLAGSGRVKEGEGSGQGAGVEET
ncbi:MAG: PPC domain-containing protein [Nitrososphaerota archaeon]